jgi:hypothetical protein
MPEVFEKIIHRLEKKQDVMASRMARYLLMSDTVTRERIVNLIEESAIKYTNKLKGKINASYGAFNCLDGERKNPEFPSFMIFVAPSSNVFADNLEKLSLPINTWSFVIGK